MRFFPLGAEASASLSLVALAGFSMPLIASEFQADPPTIVYYDIQGTTRDALREQMGKLGPKTPLGGIAYTASAEWAYSISYALREEAEGCAVDWADVRLLATITLPRWVNAEEAPVALRERWVKFYEAVERHEYGHYEFGVQMVEELQATVKPMRNREGCKALRKEIDAHSGKLFAKYRQLDKEFEQRTAHGAKDGVML